MEAIQFAQLLEMLAQMKVEFRRMADAAEAQVKETKAMRQMMVEAQHDREIREAWNS